MSVIKPEGDVPLNPKDLKWEWTNEVKKDQSNSSQTQGPN
jgi:hypothetical protein